MSHSATLLPTDTVPTSVDADIPLIVTLAEAAELPVALVGHKARQLGRLLQAGVKVPDGFCITSHALQSNDAAGLHKALAAQVITARQQLGGPVVAVRSSAAEEDSTQASWAGLFRTHLNIDNDQALLAAVHDCWLSLHSELARRYRAVLPSHSIQCPPTMAVVIQCQVSASTSGVLFTRDPMQPRKLQFCVNAVQGLAEPLVSGELTGDRYRLTPQGALISQQIHQQTERLSHTGRHSLPPEKGRRSSLSDQQLQQLCAAGKRLEALFGAPQDIEFAFDNDELWLLQSRPIVAPTGAPDNDAMERYRKQETGELKRALSRLVEHRILRQGPGILSNGNIGELLPLPTPMSFALFQHIFTGEGGAISRGRKTLGYQISPRANRELFTLVAGQPYFHLELDARTYDLRTPQPVATYLEWVRQKPSRANYPEFGLYHQCIEEAEATRLLGDESGPAFAEHSKLHNDSMARYARDYYPRYRRRIQRELERHATSMRRCEPGNTSQALLIRISALIQHLQQVSCYHFVIAARLGFYFSESVRSRLQRWLPEQTSSLMGQLLQALPGSRITEQILDLDALRRGELNHDQFLENYGHLAITELEISQPRFHEAPQLLTQICSQPNERANSRRQFRQQFRHRKGVERLLRQTLSDTDCPPAEQQLLFRDLRYARRYLPLRESIKYHFAAEYDLLRQTLLTYAATTGINGDDLFYLEPAELPLAQNRQTQAQRLIEQRRRQHQLAKAVAASTPTPAVIFGDQLDDLFQPPGARGGENWQGEGIAPGIRRGRLRLVDEHSDISALANSLQPGDILVTRSANLGLAPLLRRVAGLVVEIGGFLAHAACQAREAGIPAIVLPDATRLLADGSQVCVDGDSGTVYLTQ